MDVETLRMGERIIIALGGILSIILGYKLFFVASIKTDSGADFKSSLFNASFTKVGPGVFFALFGAYVMSMSVKTQINIETHQGNQPTVNQTAPNQAGILSQMSTAIIKLPESPEKLQLSGLIRQLQLSSGASPTKKMLID